MAFSNYILYIHKCVLIATVLSLGHRSQGCNLMEIQNCPHIDQLISGHFLGFIPYSELDDHCRTLRNALNCALKKDYVGGCEMIQTAIFVSQRAVVSVVCDQYRYAYTKGQLCFTTDGVQDDVKRCIPRLTLNCDTLEEARYCVRDAFSGRSDHCETQDVNLMAFLMEAYLKPFSDAQECDWVDRDVGSIAMPTPKSAPTTVASSTEAPTASTEALSQNSSTSHYSDTPAEHVGRSKNRGEVLEATRPVVGFLCLLALCVLS